MKKIIILTLVMMNLIGCDEIEQQLEDAQDSIPSVVSECGDGFITDYLKNDSLVLSEDLNGVVQDGGDGYFFIVDVEFLEGETGTAFLATHYIASDASGSDKEQNSSVSGVIYGNDHIFKDPCTDETHNNF